MFPEYPDLDEIIDWSASKFGKPQVSGKTLYVPVCNLWVGEKFPGHEEPILYEEATLIFEDVVSSNRAVFEYLTPDGKGFKDKVIVSDGPFDEVTNKQMYSFYIGGISYDPFAWIEWEIIANSLRVE